MNWLRGVNATLVTLATIAAAAVVGAAGIGVVGQQTDGKSPKDCDAIFERVDRLSPELKEAYAQPGHAIRLPQLADAEETRRCGDPEELLELSP